MEQIRNQKVLQYRFWFRVIVLLASIGGCVLYAIYNNSDGTNFWGVVLGMAGSALVWSCVELVDFFVETNRLFTIERRQYFLMVGEYWSKLRDVFKSETDVEKIPWDAVMNIVDELYNKTAHFPFQGGFYSISQEFETAATYITRMYWKVHGYRCSKTRKKMNANEYWAPFYKDFVMITDESSPNVIEELKRFSHIDKQIDELRKTEVSFQEYDHPKDLLSNNDQGDLGASVSFGSSRGKQYITFKPAYDFRKEFHEKSSPNMICTVWGLLTRTIKKWD